MTFATNLAELPNAARQPDASGFLPPIFRAAGHLLFVLAATAGDEQAISEEEALTELRHAAGHWDAIDGLESLSETSAAIVQRFGVTLADAIAEWTDWNADQRTRNIRDLSNRVASFAVSLDRELVGLRNSDAGTRL